MSIDTEERELTAPGVPELTALGKRIEMLRLDRRLSKGVLAQRAGTSRQQLWRVMTGKSELTSSLCARLSEVLEIDSRRLTSLADHDGDDDRLPRLLAERIAPARVSYQLLPRDEGSAVAGICQTIEEYVAEPDGLARTLETLPATDDGRRLKRVLLDAIEDIAIERSIKLPQSLFDLRRGVVNDDV
jgi:transcriptional regulator with XRE-family HTH domain